MCHLSWAHKEGKNVTLQEPGASLQNELPVFEKSAKRTDEHEEGG